MKDYLRNDRFLSWIILAALGVVWGSSFILIKKALIAFGPLQLASVRMTIASVAFVPIFILQSKSIDWSKWKALLVVGFAGSGLPAFFFALAQTELNSAITGVLNSFTPLSTFLVGFLLFGAAFNQRKLLGILIGLTGAVMLLYFGNEAGSAGNVWYGLLVVMAGLCYAISSNTVAKHLQEVKSLTISTASYVLMIIPSIIFWWYSGVTGVLQIHPSGWKAFGYAALLALASTVFASVLYFKLIQIKNAVFASFVSYLVPLIAVCWGVADGETVTLFSLSGMLLILWGVYIARK